MDTPPFFGHIFICAVIFLLCYNCCSRSARDREGSRERHGDDDGGGGDDGEELRRFRERLSERSDAAARDAENSAGAAADRTELIEKNLFSRKITREESVKELARLLAVSRGGAVDEELGGCHADPAAASTSGGDDGAATSVNPPDDLPTDPTLSMTDASASSESSSPTYSASQVAGAPTTTASAVETTSTATATSRTTPIDTIATAISSPPQDPPASNNPPLLHPITLEPIRNLLSNLTYTLQSSSERGTEREVSVRSATSASSGGGRPPMFQKNSNLNTGQKLECSICLDRYSPGDTICWAKDGGDIPTLSSATVSLNNEMGCDHIFHKECIAAWLQDHDECPLCRRKVVHADPDTRFAGWGM